MTGQIYSQDPFYGTTSFTVFYQESQSVKDQWSKYNSPCKAHARSDNFLNTWIQHPPSKEARDPPLPNFSNETQTLQACTADTDLMQDWFVFWK